MRQFLRNLFASPEQLLAVCSRHERMEARQEGQRILIDEDGNVSVNTDSQEAQEDFARHVAALRDTQKNDQEESGAR
ncbi:hypothetical protein PMPD1_3477 [Paramixta manurensis]|uniref:Uncharacterized protein n=1 Tax=Paramixta manurensis TaxID=2740817 RepID=A0A6M8UFL5_9GAMM|nr:hypothetical protein PMPD1_3477 [Erwiniaceae bacterium PD-1]